MKRTVWDRIERVDAATAMDSGWDGEDAPTNVAPPAFVKPSRSNGGFWKGVIVGVGVCAILAGFATVGGAVVVVAVVGFPALPLAGPAAIARTVEPKADPVIVEETVAVVEEPKAPVLPRVEPVVEEPKAPVVARVEPVATPVIAKVESRPAQKVVARAKPEPKRAPAPAHVTPPLATVAKVIATPAPAVMPAPAPPRPNREELLQLALAAKQTRSVPAPTPAPPKWEEPEPKQVDVAAAEEKWSPVDDTEATSTSTDASSDDLSKLLEL